MQRSGQRPGRDSDAETVILLHTLALSGAVWEAWIGVLGQRWRVEAPDLRGHGGSPWDGQPFTIWDVADDIEAYARARDIASAHVVGASMGGCVAIALAQRHPALVRSLSLLDTTAWYGPTAAADWSERAERALGPRAVQLEWPLERWFTPEFLAEAETTRALVSRLFLATSGRGHAAACSALGGFDARRGLEGIGAPTIVLTGEHDGATPPAMGRALAETVGRGEFVVVPAARHFSFLESSYPLERVMAHLENVARVAPPHPASSSLRTTVAPEAGRAR